jgi:hypothetical protein
VIRVSGVYDQILSDIRIRLNCLERQRLASRIVNRNCEIIDADEEKRGMNRKLWQDIFGVEHVLSGAAPRLAEVSDPS